MAEEFLKLLLQNSKANSEFEAISNYIRANEGTESSVYKDTSGNKTIGVGHLIKPGEDVSKINIEDTFKNDVISKIATAKRLFPKYDTLPIEVKQALVDGVFRGEYKKGHKTVEYINKGEWDKVPDEYRNRDDYRESIKKGTGIAPRMDRNADAFRVLGDR